MPRPKSPVRSSKPERAPRRKAKSLTQPKKRSGEIAKVQAPKRVNPRSKEAIKREKVTLRGAQVQQLIDAAAVTSSITAGVHATESGMDLARAQELAREPEVAGAIMNLRRTLAQECGITSRRVMEELRNIAFSNMADYMRVTSEGQPVTDFTNLTREQWAAVQEITVEEYVERKEGAEDEFERVKRTKFKLYPKRDSLVDLAKHLGIKGFGNQIVGKVGMGLKSNPDGSFEAAVLVQLSDAELERIAAGIEDAGDEERTE